MPFPYNTECLLHRCVTELSFYIWSFPTMPQEASHVKSELPPHLPMIYSLGIKLGSKHNALCVNSERSIYFLRLHFLKEVLVPAKLRKRCRNFPYIPCHHTRIASPIINISHQMVHFLPRISLH